VNKTRILSWNVNGLRAVGKKDFLPWLLKESPDVLCVQEIKATPLQLPPELRHPPGYESFWNSAERPGYSGVGIFTKATPLNISDKMDVPRFDNEGRWLLVEFEKFILINIYFPNGKRDAERLRYKLDFYEESLKIFTRLVKKGKRVIFCGDVNTAHAPIDLSHPEQNEDVSGFLPEERAWMDKVVKSGFIDAFRYLHPDAKEAYTWWDLRTGARARNIGWRLDYFFISTGVEAHLQEACHLTEVKGSDHCPVAITLDS